MLPSAPDGWRRVRDHRPAMIALHPSHTPRLTEDINTGDGSECSFFENFMDNELLTHFLRETNSYARGPSWINVTRRTSRGCGSCEPGHLVRALIVSHLGSVHILRHH